MAEPKPLGRVDWMPRKKVWRVIQYKGAVDIPAGDYPTKEEAEDALRVLVARGNPTPVTPEVTKGEVDFQIDVEDVAKGYEPSTVTVGDSIRLVGEPTDVGFPHKVLDIRVVPDIGEPQLLLTTKGGNRWVTGPFAELSKVAIPKAEVVRPPVDVFERRLTGELIKGQREITEARVPVTPEVTIEHRGTEPEGRAIGDKLGIAYDGKQEIVGMQFTDIAVTGTTFYGNTLEAVRAKLIEKRRLFGKEGGNPMKTETERKSFHERIFGKGSTPPLERLGKGETMNNLLPMSPVEGPPLPKMLALKWPWKK